ncbi:MAG: EVE domain-containing protein [Polyangiales bacterium]
MKSEPDVYSIDDLATQGTGTWEGVRNYQARNFMREMQVGDLVLFYHSNAEPSGVVGVAAVARAAYTDPFQFEPESPYFDPKSPKDAPRWSAVDVSFVEKLPKPVTLAAMKADPALEGLKVIEKGSRLSVTPVEPSHFRRIVALGGGRTQVRG